MESIERIEILSNRLVRPPHLINAKDYSAIYENVDKWSTQVDTPTLPKNANKEGINALNAPEAASQKPTVYKSPERLDGNSKFLLDNEIDIFEKVLNRKRSGQQPSSSKIPKKVAVDVMADCIRSHILRKEEPAPIKVQDCTVNKRDQKENWCPPIYANKIIIPDNISEELLKTSKEDNVIALQVTQRKEFIFRKRLIRNVRRHRAIYDTNCKLFSSVPAKEEAWQKISKRLGREVDVCKNTWVDLRYMYQRYARKLRKFLLSGNTNRKRRPVMAFERDLLFLWRFIADRSFLQSKFLSAVKGKVLPTNTNAGEEDDVVFVLEDNPIVVIDVDAEPVDRSAKEQNKSQTMLITSEVRKFIDLLQAYPELYDTDNPYYNDHRRKGIIWNALANELKDKATKLMKLWVYLQTRYEWETFFTSSNQKTELEDVLGFLRPFILKNPNTVYKQSFYLKTSWQEPIEHFKNIFQLLVIIRRFPSLINYSDEDLLSPHKGKEYHCNWLEIGRIRECSAGQCEVTWLIMRFFYMQLVEMRQRTYQLQDKWYFESIISELFANAAPKPPVEPTIAPDRSFHAKSFAISTPILKKPEPEGENNNLKSTAAPEEEAARANSVAMASLSSPAQSDKIPAKSAPSSQKAMSAKEYRPTHPKPASTTNSEASSQPSVAIPSMAPAVSTTPPAVISANLAQPSANSDNGVNAVTIPRVASAVYSATPIAISKKISLANSNAAIISNYLTAGTTTGRSVPTISPKITAAPASGASTSSSYMTPPSVFNARPTLPLTQSSASNASTISGSVMTAIPFSASWLTADTASANVPTSINNNNTKSVTVPGKTKTVLVKRKKAKAPPVPQPLPPPPPPPPLAPMSQHGQNFSLPIYTTTSSMSSFATTETTVYPQEPSSFPTYTTTSLSSAGIGETSVPKISSAMSLLSSNEIIVELVATSYGNQLVVHGPPLSESYSMSMETTMKFIREVMAIPTIHSTCSPTSTLNNCWQHLSNMFSIPSYICKACWSFLAENFSHFNQIAPIEELMRPPFTSDLDVWTHSTELFQKFEFLTAVRGWLRYKYDLIDLISEIIKSPESLDSDLGLREPFLEQLPSRFYHMREILDIWNTLKNTFLAYMKDLERCVDNKWPDYWAPVFASMQFLLDKVYTTSDPFYYIIRSKIFEEINNCEEQQQQSRINLQEGCSSSFAVPSVRIKDVGGMRSFSAVEIYSLMVYIRQNSEIYMDRDERKRLDAWQAVASKMNATVHECRTAFIVAVREYYRYINRDAFNRCKLNNLYFTPVSQILSSIQHHKSTQKLSIKTPSELNESVANRKDDASETAWPEHFIMDINMDNSKASLVMKNWSHAVRPFALTTQSFMEESLRSLFKKYREYSQV